MITSNGSPVYFYQETPPNYTRCIARVWVTGLLRRKTIERVPYLIRDSFSLLRLFRVFDQIWKTEWEWFR
jgi:hypothetical protein